MANGDCKEIFATFVGVEKTACVQAAAALAWPSDIFIFLPLLEPKLPFCERSNTIKRRALRQPLARGYLFETQKQTISMEMQCLHAWWKSIICHFENVQSASRGFSFILLAAFLSLLACFILFFPPCARPEEKKQMV